MKKILWVFQKIKTLNKKKVVKYMTAPNNYDGDDNLIDDNTLKTAETPI